MGETFHIVSDGSCDLPSELAQEKNITVVPFYVSFDDVHYLKEKEEIDVRDFYQQMVDKKGVFPKSSMPSIHDYEEAFLPSAKSGTPVICICITTKFSGSMQSALNARDSILESYPDAQITVIDATVNTVLQGQLVLQAAALRDSGAGFHETAARIEEIKETGRIFFTIGSMEYLKHGGRIGKVASVAGSVLNIRPVITLKQGEIFPKLCPFSTKFDFYLVLSRKPYYNKLSKKPRLQELKQSIFTARAEADSGGRGTRA